LTKIKLLDLATGGLTITFYLTNQISSARRVLSDANSTQKFNTTKSTYSFFVISDTKPSGEECKSFAACNFGAIIISVSVVVAAIIIGVVVYCVIRSCRRNTGEKYEDKKEEKKENVMDVGGE